MPVKQLSPRRQFLNREPGLAQQTAERAFGDLIVVWDDQPSMGRLGMAKDDVAAALPVHRIAEFGGHFYQLPAG